MVHQLTGRENVPPTGNPDMPDIIKHAVKIESAMYNKADTRVIGSNPQSYKSMDDEIIVLDEDPALVVKTELEKLPVSQHVVANSCQNKASALKSSAALKATASSKLEASNDARSLALTLALAFSLEAQNQKFEQNIAGARISELQATNWNLT